MAVNHFKGVNLADCPKVPFRFHPKDSLISGLFANYS